METEINFSLRFKYTQIIYNAKMGNHTKLWFPIFCSLLTAILVLFWLRQSAHTPQTDAKCGKIVQRTDAAGDKIPANPKPINVPLNPITNQ